MLSGLTLAAADGSMLAKASACTHLDIPIDDIPLMTLKQHVEHAPHDGRRLSFLQLPAPGLQQGLDGAAGHHLLHQVGILLVLVQACQSKVLVRGRGVGGVKRGAGDGMSEWVER